MVVSKVAASQPGAPVAFPSLSSELPREEWALSIPLTSELFYFLHPLTLS